MIASPENGSRGNGPRRLLVKASRIFQIILVFGADNILFLLLGEQNANLLSLRDSINWKFAAQNLSALSKAERDHPLSPIQYISERYTSMHGDINENQLIVLGMFRTSGVYSECPSMHLSILNQ